MNRGPNYDALLAKYRAAAEKATNALRSMAFSREIYADQRSSIIEAIFALDEAIDLAATKPKRASRAKVAP